ncbi:bifunctional heptose 7-phosphate kinase/heptose 1-phosphate adenyltransferase [Sediminibacterium soli]|uniref:bifunctional heptose 7-phosphate kinase/heptose 1-phosphate adenyltransferase n=1 Tax=Sediminibacterium soli TaxID=2698829 RepID=UPI00137B73B9|nr:bifunctional ADP-heptose synthase [Sediminibacterium soli]NCI45626.1 carbohydrate kinase [Sediminibacterium soli]
MDFESFFTRLGSLRVLIIGDIMLDTYLWGNVERISPEAPVPVVALKKKELRVGGAANVALNTAALGAHTSIISVTGDDMDASDLDQLLVQSHIDTSWIIRSSKRITTNKTRVMSRNQQMMRLDAEITADIDSELEEAVIGKVKAFFAARKPDVVIFEDYNKGVLTTRLIEELIRFCRKENVVTAVDPKKKNFLAYREVTIFKPNLKEVREGLNLHTDQVDLSSLQEMHQALQQQLKHEISFITLSEKGVFYKQDEQARIIPTHIRSIADVSGAGDTVIAVAALVYTLSKDMHLAAEMANIAGGLVCEEVGTAAINRQKFLDECELLLGE